MSDETTAPTAPSAVVPPVQAVQENRFDSSPELGDRIFERLTRSGPGALSGGEIIRRKTVSFRLDGQVCTPYFFWDQGSGEYLDVEITLRGLTSTEEIEALQGLTDAGQVPYLLGRAALYALNGHAIPPDRKDFFWEGLGMGGRQLCLMAFQHVGGASGAAVGKYQRSISAG